MILDFQLTGLVCDKDGQQFLDCRTSDIPCTCMHLRKYVLVSDPLVTYDIVCLSRKCHRIGLEFCLYCVTIVSGKTSVADVSVRNGLDC